MHHYASSPPYLAPRGEYASYYVKSQYGKGLNPAYGGAPRQKGHGLGSLLGGLLRGAVPLLRSIGPKVAKVAGSALLSTGAGVLADMIAGKKLGTSVKARAKAGGRQLLHSAANSAQGYINNLASGTSAKRRPTAKGRGRGKKKKQTGGSKRKRAPSQAKSRKRAKTTLLF